MKKILLICKKNLKICLPSQLYLLLILLFKLYKQVKVRKHFNLTKIQMKKINFFEVGKQN